MSPRSQGRFPASIARSACAGEGGAGHHVLRRAHEQAELLHLLHDLGHACRWRSPADHGNGLAREIDVVAPARGVEDRALLEVLASRDVRDVRLLEQPDGGDEDRRDEGLTLGCRDRPMPGLLVKPRGDDFCIQLDVWAHLVFVIDLLDVIEDFVARRERPGPQIVLLARQRVAAKPRRTPRPDSCCRATFRPPRTRVPES